MPTLTAVLEVVGFATGARLMVDSTLSIARSLVDAQMQMQAMENTLITATGSLAGSRTEIEYLYEFADKLGASFTGAVIPYAKLASSIRGMETSELHSVFEGFQTALVATHASTETVSNAFLALQQIASKGKLNMQDLRRQFAEHIPGAMRVFADAMDMTMDQFNKAVHDGSINVNEFLIKSADAFKNKFGPAAEAASHSLQAEVNRLSAGWLKYRTDILEASGANDNFAETVRNVKVFLDEIADDPSFAEAIGKWSQLLNTAMGESHEAAAESAGFFAELMGNTADELAHARSVMAGTKNTTLNLTAALLEWVGAEETASQLRKDANEQQKIAAEYINLTTEDTKLLTDTKTYLNDLVEESNKLAQEAADADKIAAEEAEKHELALMEQKKAQEELAKATADRIKLVAEAYKATGAMEEEYFANSIAKIREQADTWIAAGADMVEVNQWVEDSIRTLKGELTDEEYAVQANAEAAEWYASVYGDDVVVAQESATEAVGGMTAAVNEQAESVGQSSYAYESVADAMSGYGQAIVDTSSVIDGFRITEAKAAAESIKNTNAMRAAKEEAANAERERLATSLEEWTKYGEDVLRVQSKVTDEISRLEDRKAKKHLETIKLNEKIDKEYSDLEDDISKKKLSLMKLREKAEKELASTQGEVHDSTLLAIQQEQTALEELVASRGAVSKSVRASLDLAVSEYNKIGQELEAEVARQKELASDLVKASQMKSSITQAASNLTSYSGGSSVSTIFGGSTQSGGGVKFYFNQNVSRSDINNITSQQTRNASR